MYRRAWHSPNNSTPAGLRRAATDVLGIVVSRCAARRNELCDLLGSGRCRVRFGHCHGLGLRLPCRRKLAEPIILKTFVEQCLSTNKLDFNAGVLEGACLTSTGDNHIVAQWRQQVA